MASERPLRVVSSPRELADLCEDARRDGRKIALVPTMGALHAGHVSLLEHARRRADVVVLTIFVNPTQFAPTEDLSRYPRDLDGDLAKARAAGVDLAFTPAADAMYAKDHATTVRVAGLTEGMCGASRPGHFEGVATVVTKLFALVRPHVAVFGQKDYQQLAVIRRLARDLDLGVEIVGAPIARDADGLALSSRNVYLSAEERSSALALSRALAAAEAAVAKGERDAATLVELARGILAADPGIRLDYVELRDAESLTTLTRLDRPGVLALAAFLGKTRLIDNRVLAA